MIHMISRVCEYIHLSSEFPSISNAGEEIRPLSVREARASPKDDAVLRMEVRLLPTFT